MTTKKLTDLNLSEIDTTILQCITLNNVNAIAGEKLKAKGAGVYATFTALAATTGQVEFEAHMTSVFEMIRTNKNGVAKLSKCAPAKKKGTFTVPSAAMSAKSVLLSAMEYHLPLLDDDSGEALSFSSIRKSVSEAKAIEAAENMSEDEKIKATLLDALNELSGVIKDAEVDSVLADHYVSLILTVKEATDDILSVAGEEPEQDDGEVMSSAEAA